MQWYLNRKNIFCLRQNRFPFEENYITFYYLITWSQIDILSHELHNQILFHHNLSFLFKNSFQPLNYLCWFVYIFYVWFCIIINSEQIHFLHFSNVMLTVKMIYNVKINETPFYSSISLCFLHTSLSEFNAIYCLLNDRYKYIMANNPLRDKQWIPRRL